MTVDYYMTLLERIAESGRCPECEAWLWLVMLQNGSRLRLNLDWTEHRHQ